MAYHNEEVFDNLFDIELPAGTHRHSKSTYLDLLANAPDLVDRRTMPRRIAGPQPTEQNPSKVKVRPLQADALQGQ